MNSRRSRCRMSDLCYYAVLSREGSYTLARIAGLPGCNTFAKLKQSIEKQALEALVGHLEARLLLKRKIGRPKSLAVALKMLNDGESVMRLDVPKRLAAKVKKSWAR